MAVSSCRNPVFIKTYDQALEELEVVLGFPERRTQIIEVTKRIAVCLDKAPRDFLVDCQTAIIEGGLEALARRRHEQLAAYAEKQEKEALQEASKVEEGATVELPLPQADFIEIEVPVPDEAILLPAAKSIPKPKPDEADDLEEADFKPEPMPELAESETRFVLPPVRETSGPQKISIPVARRLTPDKLADPLMEEVGSALDILKVVNIARQVFPELRENRPRWALARVIQGHEEEIRGTLEEAMKYRSDRDRFGGLQAKIVAKVDAENPPWKKHADQLLASCRHAVKILTKHMKVHKDADQPELLWTIIAMNDDRVEALMREVRKSPADAVAFVVDIRMCVDWIRAAEESGQL